MPDNLGIGRWLAVFVGSVDDQRDEIVLVEVPALFAGPVQNGPLKVLRMSQHRAVARSQKVDWAADHDRIEIVLQMLLEMLDHAGLALPIVAEQEREREALHELLRQRPEIDRLADR